MTGVRWLLHVTISGVVGFLVGYSLSKLWLAKLRRHR